MTVKKEAETIFKQIKENIGEDLLVKILQQTFVDKVDGEDAAEKAK
jgi:hypothetical protein